MLETLSFSRPSSLSAADVVEELQLDEIRTFAPRKSEVCWVFTSIEVTSRLWPSTVVGRRSYRNTEKLLRETIQRGEFATPFLITTDGFKYYKRVVQQLLGPACLYGQVQKMWRNNRVVFAVSGRDAGRPVRLAA